MVKKSNNLSHRIVLLVLLLTGLSLLRVSAQIPQNTTYVNQSASVQGIPSCICAVNSSTTPAFMVSCADTNRKGSLYMWNNMSCSNSGTVACNGVYIQSPILKAHSQVFDIFVTGNDVFFCGAIVEGQAHVGGIIGHIDISGTSLVCDCCHITDPSICAVKKVVAFPSGTGFEVVALASGSPTVEFLNDQLLHFNYMPGDFGSPVNIKRYISNKTTYEETWSELIDCGSDVVILGEAKDNASLLPGVVVRALPKATLDYSMLTANASLLLCPINKVSFPHAAYITETMIAFAQEDQAQLNHNVYTYDYASRLILSAQSIACAAKNTIKDLVYLPDSNKLVMNRQGPNILFAHALTEFDIVYPGFYATREIEPVRKFLMDQCAVYGGGFLAATGEIDCFAKDYSMNPTSPSCYTPWTMEVFEAKIPVVSTIPACSPLPVVSTSPMRCFRGTYKLKKECCQ